MTAKCSLKQKLLHKSPCNDQWPGTISLSISFVIREVNILGTANLWEVTWFFRYLDGRKGERQQLQLDTLSFTHYLGVLNWELCQSEMGEQNQTIHQYQTTHIVLKLYIKCQYQTIHKNELETINKSKFMQILKERWPSILNASLCDAEKNPCTQFIGQLKILLDDFLKIRFPG